MLVSILVILVLLALALYCVSLIPLPGPPEIKLLIQAICVLLAIAAIANRAGIGLG